MERDIKSNDPEALINYLLWLRDRNKEKYPLANDSPPILGSHEDRLVKIVDLIEGLHTDVSKDSLADPVLKTLLSMSAFSLGNAYAIVHRNIHADYEWYLNSEQWKHIRKVVSERDRSTCQNCKRRWLDGETTFDVHHLTYERRGQERPEDLQLLCRKCHDATHEAGKMKHQATTGQVIARTAVVQG